MKNEKIERIGNIMRDELEILRKTRSGGEQETCLIILDDCLDELAFQKEVWDEDQKFYWDIQNILSMARSKMRKHGLKRKFPDLYNRIIKLMRTK